MLRYSGLGVEHYYPPERKVSEMTEAERRKLAQFNALPPQKRADALYRWAETLAVADQGRGQNTKIISHLVGLGTKAEQESKSEKPKRQERATVAYRRIKGRTVPIKKTVIRERATRLPEGMSPHDRLIQVLQQSGGDSSLAGLRTSFPSGTNVTKLLKDLEQAGWIYFHEGTQTWNLRDKPKPAMPGQGMSYSEMIARPATTRGTRWVTIRGKKVPLKT